MTVSASADVAKAERIVRESGLPLPAIGTLHGVSPHFRLVHAIADALSVAREEAQARHIADLRRIHAIYADDDERGSSLRDRLLEIGSFCRGRLTELAGDTDVTNPA